MSVEQETQAPQWWQVFTWPREYGSDEGKNAFGYFGVALVVGAFFATTQAVQMHQPWWFVGTFVCVIAYLGTGLAFYLFELALFNKDS